MLAAKKLVELGTKGYEEDWTDTVMKKKDLLTADYEKAAAALTWEVFQGNIHIDICEHIAAMDPIIGNHAPTVFTYTFHAPLSAAQLYAYKLFDSHDQAFTVTQILGDVTPADWGVQECRPRRRE